jgi:hypothetical protein
MVFYIYDANKSTSDLRKLFNILSSTYGEIKISDDEYILNTNLDIIEDKAYIKCSIKDMEKHDPKFAYCFSTGYPRQCVQGKCILKYVKTNLPMRKHFYFDNGVYQIRNGKLYLRRFQNISNAINYLIIYSHGVIFNAEFDIRDMN